LRKIVAFRVDASTTIGLGHASRCLVLARELQRLGYASHFFCRQLSGNAGRIFIKAGFPVHWLGKEVSPGIGKMSELLRRKDASETARLLRRYRCVCLVVDHYKLGCAWEHQVRDQWQVPMVALEDLPVRRHVSDLLVDPSAGRSPRVYQKKIPKTCRLLLGPRYALVARAFSPARLKVDVRQKQILIFVGGMDHRNATLKILRHLHCLSEIRNVGLRVVLGAKAPWKKRIRSALLSFHPRARLEVNVRNMAGLMRKCQIGILAPGTVAWEALAAGLPSLLLATAPHQVQNARNLHRMGCARYLGMVSGVSSRLLRKELRPLLGSRTARHRLIQKAKKLVDTHGPQRVAQAIHHLVKKHD